MIWTKANSKKNMIELLATMRSTLIIQYHHTFTSHGARPSTANSGKLESSKRIRARGEEAIWASVGLKELDPLGWFFIPFKGSTTRGVSSIWNIPKPSWTSFRWQKQIFRPKLIYHPVHPKGNAVPTSPFHHTTLSQLWAPAESMKVVEFTDLRNAKILHIIGNDDCYGVCVCYYELSLANSMDWGLLHPFAMCCALQKCLLARDQAVLCVEAWWN